MKTFTILNDSDLNNVKQWIYSRYPSKEANQEGTDTITKTVQWIIDTVRKNGDNSIIEFTKQFDGVSLTPEELEVPKQEIVKSFNALDPRILKIIENSANNIRIFHSKNLRNSWEETLEDGTILGQKITPIEKVGVYVPGGKAFYPSSVLMNIIPAQIAGVKEIIMVSPPSYNGTIHPIVLATAHLAGATRVFRIGGAQSIAALAYGTEHIPSVDKITGPGNIYVATAKAIVRETVDIDCEAGPSEVLVIADKNANPDFVTAELLAQAEHDENACSVLITTQADKDIVEIVNEQIQQFLAKLKRKETIEKSLSQYGAYIIARDWDEVIELTNYFAPEHLSIQTEYPRKIEEKIINAGAIMLGNMTPVAVGDYIAGPNHILPTGRRARFSSPLTVEEFRKVTNFIYYSKSRLLNQADDIISFAEIEGLTAHAFSVELRTGIKRNMSHE
ncbi:MAG TPA: histidinol dehydrogenase [Candidatus Hydrogenedens sp.]|nr:histidinol dehydrogenase [Candidatus Hydrogenedens sp.]